MYTSFQLHCTLDQDYPWMLYSLHVCLSYFAVRTSNPPWKLFCSHDQYLSSCPRNCSPDLCIESFSCRFVLYLLWPLRHSSQSNLHHCIHSTCSPWLLAFALFSFTVTGQHRLALFQIVDLLQAFRLLICALYFLLNNHMPGNPARTGFVPNNLKTTFRYDPKKAQTCPYHWRYSKDADLSRSKRF